MPGLRRSSRRNMSRLRARIRISSSVARRLLKKAKAVARVSPRSSLLLLAAVICVPIAVLTAQAPLQPSFRTGVELVSLNVTVSEGQHYVTDLEQGDFNV